MPCRRVRSLLVGLGVAVMACAPVAGAGADGSGGIDLHGFDWNQAKLPGWVCGADQPIKLHSGYADFHSRRWPALSPIEAARGRVVYGDLNGGGSDAAALQIVCVNRGGTAAGQLAFTVVVFTAGLRAPTEVGVLTPQLRSGRNHVPILTPAKITHDRVVVTELYYGPRDPDCCPTGRATTVWRFQSGSLPSDLDRRTDRARQVSDRRVGGEAQPPGARSRRAGLQGRGLRRRWWPVIVEHRSEEEQRQTGERGCAG